MTAPIDVLIAEDHAVVRDALTDLLSAAPGLRVVGAACDAREAVDLAGVLRPNVALVDVKMPRGGGPWAAREIAQRSPDTAIVALTAYDDRATIIQMLRAGARSYIVKGARTGAIVEAIETASRGLATLPPEISIGVIEELVGLLDRADRDVEETRQFDRTKRALLDTLAHEVFTPVAVITGSASTIAAHAGRMSPGDVEALASGITRAVKRLRRLMNNITSACRLHGGDVPVDTLPVPLGRIAKRARIQFAEEADHVAFDLAGSSAAAWLVEDLATEALSVLIENAVEFSPVDGAPVRVVAFADAETAGFRVTDAGRGMTVEERRTAFDPFARLGDARDERHQGMGIGLYLTRQIMALHDGSVTVESEPGVGSTFTLSFPRASDMT